MERNPKRARKKEARDRRTAAYMAAYRRRRAARIVTVVAVLAAIGGLVVYVTGNDDGAGPAAGSSPSPSPSPTAAPAESPCPEIEAPESNPKTDYAGAPDPNEVLGADVDYSAVIHTSCGDIEMDLLEERSVTVANFIFLAREGFYDGLTWHRIERNFVIQAGDPNGLNGRPPDGPGYQIAEEVEGTRDRDYTFGVVGMARSSEPNTTGSQFFIVVHDPKAARAGRPPEPAGLEPLYTIFGATDERSYRVLDKIARQPIQGGTDPVTASQPVVPVYIESIDIIEN